MNDSPSLTLARRHPESAARGQDHVTIAVLLTCFNRRDKTAACLRSVAREARALPAGVDLRLIVTDDGSSDGTAAMLAAEFPAATVLRGDGNLYWSGGMRLAFGRALAEGHAFYLWLNDDVELFPGSLGRLLETHAALAAETGRGGIVLGAMCDERGALSYGGFRRHGRRFQRVPPAERPVACDTINGNCVLISRDAAAVVGNLDPVFRHGMGDMDYGLRATRAGVPIVVQPGFAGRCIHDHRVAGSYLDVSLPLAVRWRKITSPKGLPLRAWWTFCRRHSGPWWLAHWLWPYGKVVATWARRALSGGRRAHG